MAVTLLHLDMVANGAANGHSGATGLFYLNVILPFAGIAKLVLPAGCILPLTVLLRRSQ